MGEYQFSVYQIAEMAMGVEEAGVNFYKTLATVVDDKKLKDIFTALAKAELGHRDTFKNIADSFRKDDFDEYSINFPMLMKNYIDKIKEATFNMRSFSKNPASIEEAIGIAIHTEQESIRIYTEIKNMFIERFHKIFESIISEERKHLEILTDIKNKINS